MAENKRSSSTQPRTVLGGGDAYHTSTVGDFTTPLEDRGATYADDWSFALGRSP